jgi:hypothetical protein
MTKWRDLSPDERMTVALDRADAERGSRSSLIASGTSSEKNNWSNSFADACAQMVAAAMRAKVGRRLTVLPDRGGTAEPPTITYHERGQPKTKKIDVLVGDLIAGLQIAVSLKGVGFRDQAQLNFGKNITGRLYELENEARRLHEYRPQALVVGLYFVPIGAVDDKKTRRTPSGFADIVRNVRAICGRADPHRQDEWHRIDVGFVGLYVPGDVESFVIAGTAERFEYKDPFARGVVRYFDVLTDPPERGRPLVDSTITLEQMVEGILDQHGGPSATRMTYGPAEVD